MDEKEKMETETPQAEDVKAETAEAPKEEKKEPSPAELLLKALEAEAAAEKKAAELSQKLSETEARLALAVKQQERLQADFDNFRRRTRNEAATAKESMTADIAGNFLPVLDNFHLALTHMQKDAAGAPYAKGFEMLQKQLEKILADLGIEEIAAEGTAFDPRFHEAVMQAPAEGKDDDTVAMVFQKGYHLGDRVIRPAKVQVVKN